jgi:hypothetical protein
MHVWLVCVQVAEDLVVEYTQQAEEMARAGQRPDQACTCTRPPLARVWC